MLKLINPNLNADVLHALAQLGHGDKVILCDLNFPAHSVAQKSVYGRLLTMHGCSAGEAAEAVLSLMPLDFAIPKPAARMALDNAPDEIPPVQQEVQVAIDAAEGEPKPMDAIARLDFYEQARDAFCVIQCGEPRFWGCFMFTQGAIPPSEDG